MPIYDAVCTSCGDEREIFCHKSDDRARAHVCKACGEAMEFKASFGVGITYFSHKGGGRWIHNMADQPVWVDSWWKHKQLMREHGVGEAPPKRGMPGSWA